MLTTTITGLADADQAAPAGLVILATEYAGQSYGAVHAALHRRRGTATSHLCARCGRRAAQEWACRCTKRVVYGLDADGRPVTFSLDLTDYEPMCRSCHREYDAARARTRVPPTATGDARCAVCGLALHPSLASAGYRTHPSCDPDEAPRTEALGIA